MKTLISSFMAGCLLLAGSGNAVAQDDDMLVIPVELFTCNYHDGKGSGWTHGAFFFPQRKTGTR